MSGDGNLISAFKRRRETLGVLDAQHQNERGSQIPQPASVLKKSTHNTLSGARASMMSSMRNSIAPFGPAGMKRSSSGGNLADGMEAMGIGVGRDSVRFRQSYAPGSQPAVLPRRSSSYSHGKRQSSIGASGAAFGLGMGSSMAPLKDPRPVRDKNFQAQLAQQVLEYLASSGFEMEMKHPLTQRTLKSPTQKDFQYIFQFLYHRLDPGYKFVKGIEHEVILCMKCLRYPFAENLSKSQLIAVGGQNWGQYLAMLHWLVELAKVTERILLGEIRADEDSNDSSDVISFPYLAKAYRLFLQGNDEFSELEEELEEAYDVANEQVLESIEAYEKSNQELLKQFDELDVVHPPLETATEEQKVLQSDKEKFLQYIEHLKRKKQKMADTNVRVEEEIVAKQKELELLQQEKSQLQAAVDKQPISAADVDRMTAEREHLHKSLDSVSTKLDEAGKVSYEKELLGQKKADLLDKLVQTYNTKGYRIGLIPSTAANAKGRPFELDFPSSIDEIGTRPDQLVNRDLRHEVKPFLHQLRIDLGSQVHGAQDEAIRLGELLDRVIEALADKREEVEGMEARVHGAVEQYNEIKETMTAETSASNAETERLERELQQMKITAYNGLLQLEQRNQSVSIEYDQLVHASNTLRGDLYDEIVRVLDDVIKLKLHVQTSLEGYETFLVESLEKDQEDLST